MSILVSRRYERVSLIVTSNKPVSGWGEIFGGQISLVSSVRSAWGLVRK